MTNQHEPSAGRVKIYSVTYEWLFHEEIKDIERSFDRVLAVGHVLYTTYDIANFATCLHQPFLLTSCGTLFSTSDHYKKARYC